MLFPLFACPHSGQNFSLLVKGWPQLRHSKSLGIANFSFLDFISLIILVLLVEMLV